MIRPGPTAIEPGRMPGGVVIHVYSVPTQRLLVERLAHSENEVEQYAGIDAAIADATMWPEDVGVCIVVYDGDSGKRMAPHAAWT